MDHIVRYITQFENSEICYTTFLNFSWKKCNTKLTRILEDANLMLVLEL